MDNRIVALLNFFFCMILIIPEIKAVAETLDKAFYALSSLRYSLEDDAIAFEADDIDHLMATAEMEPTIAEEVQFIKSEYYKAKSSKSYPNLDGNSLIDANMKKLMRPYCMPLNHPLKKTLDEIFNDSRVTQNEETFANAGFITLCAQPTSLIRVVRHPSLPGVLLKLYLDNETRKKDDIPGWQWLVNRCKGAENVRELIKKKNLKYFSVPDKWIYPLPENPGSTPKEFQQPVILVVTDMDLASDNETRDKWKNGITKKHLDELFCILSHGYSSCYLAQNIPLSKNGTFTCIDTEHPKRKLSYHHVKAYLSPKMKAYWDKIIKTGGKI